MKTLFFMLVIFGCANRLAHGQDVQERKSLDGSEKYPEYMVRDDDTKLTKLKKRQINAALNAFEATRHQMRSGETNIFALREIQKQLLDVQMRFHTKPEAKIKVLNAALDLAKKIESQYIEMFDAGIARVSDLEFASFNRLDIEIRIEEIQSKK